MKRFPKNEQIEYKEFYSGVFKDFQMYGFYFKNKLLGFVHFGENKEFVHLNYLAFHKKHRGKGIGSYIISWLKNKFNNKPLVADVENLDESAKNNTQRLKRLKFYYRNGFFDGISEFEWESSQMYYINTAKISNKAFMDHIQICFPTIKDIRLHEDNYNKVITN